MLYSKQKGFTLIELLIVVAIIAILAAIAVPNFMEAQTRAKVSRVKSDMRSLATALESYYIDHNNYVPGGVAVGGWGIANPVSYTAHRPDTYNGNDTSSGGFFYMLSTPVAYIANSFVEDPFGKREGDLNSDNYLKRYVRYTTGNSETFIGHWGDYFDDGPSWPKRVHERGKFLNYLGGQGRFPGGMGLSGDTDYGSSLIDGWFLWSVGPDEETGVFAPIYEDPGVAPNDYVIKFLDVGNLASNSNGHPPFKQMLTHEFGDGTTGYTNAHHVLSTGHLLMSHFVYDPTNGTKSQGNIYKVGGARYSESNIPLYNRIGPNFTFLSNCLADIVE